MRAYCIAVATTLVAVPAARADAVAVSSADCQRLVTHIPAPDVEYRPGVDVHGKPVVPADLNGGSTIALPQSIDINIGVNLARRLTPQAAQSASGTGAASSQAKPPLYAYAPLGTVTVKGNDVYWNGALIGAPDAAELIAACRQSLATAGATLPAAKPAPPK